MSAWISQQMAALDGWVGENEQLLLIWVLGLVAGWVLGVMWEQRGRGHE
jgi:hypothetical protein